MRDDREFNIAFVSLVRQLPCLYDYTSLDYLSKATQMRAWETIANEVNETVQECKDRWKNLRGCFTRHLKAKAESSGCHRKPYYLASHLSFLIPFTKSMGQTRDSVEVLQNGEDETAQEDKDDEGKEAQESDKNAETKLEEENNVNSSPICQIKREFPEEEFKWTTVKKVKRVINAEATEEDADVQFLKSLLPDIRQMDGSQKRRFKMGVIQLCDDILNESNFHMT